MKYLHQWGFTPDSWKGDRGEYWVLAQLALLLGFVLVPVYPAIAAALPQPALYGLRALAGILVVSAAVLLGKGLIDLGPNLTPLPYPRDDGELVQTGIYGVVRHSLYSGLVLGTLGLGLWWVSLSHLAVALALGVVLDRKASREEQWLQERFPAYADYRQRVKKLIPWVY